MSSTFNPKPQKNITSISLKFLLFFFKKIGIHKITVIDFSCGVVDDYYLDENREQGWTAHNSPTLEDEPIETVLKDPGVPEAARGKRRTRKNKKRRTRKKKKPSRKSKKKPLSLKKRTNRKNH